MNSRTSWLLGSLYLAVHAVVASAQPCSIEQVTVSVGGPHPAFANFAPEISLSGATIAFHSNRLFVPVPSSADGENDEIFLFDRETGSFTQVTDSRGGDGSRRPAFSKDESKLVFDSDRDLTGYNPDMNREIFLFDITNVTLTQITDTTSAFSSNPSANINGDRLVFISSADLVSGGNADGNVEIFLYDSSIGFTQITNSTRSAFQGVPTLDSEGDLVAFHSFDNLVGTNPDENREVFTYSSESGLVQITDTTGGLGNLTPQVSVDGSRVVLVSDRDLVPGMNPDNDVYIFMYDVGTREIVQLVEGRAPVLSADLRYMAYRTSGFVARLYLADFTAIHTPTLLRSSTFPGISKYGLLLVFRDRGDPVGLNPDGNSEIYVATCPDLLFQDGFESGDTTLWN